MRVACIRARRLLAGQDSTQAPQKQRGRRKHIVLAGQGDRAIHPGEAGGTRTLDPAIKSRLLCQLSYRPGRARLTVEWRAASIGEMAAVPHFQRGSCSQLARDPVHSRPIVPRAPAHLPATSPAPARAPGKDALLARSWPLLLFVRRLLPGGRMSCGILARTGMTGTREALPAAHGPSLLSAV